MIDWSLQDRQQLYWHGLLIRGVAAGAFLAFFAAAWLSGVSSKIDGFWLVVAGCVVLISINPVWWLVGRTRGFELKDFRYHWALDVVVVAFFVYALGVFDIAIVPSAFLIMIVSSATFADGRTAFRLATVSAVAYAVVAMLEEWRYLPHWHVSFGLHYDSEGRAFLFVAYVILFVLFGFLASTLAEELRRKMQEVEEQRRSVQEAYAEERLAREDLSLLARLVQHDLYGPLGVISGACSVAKADLVDRNVEAATRGLELIDQRLRSLESAAKSLNLFSGDEADTSGDCDAHTIVNELLEDLATEIAERRIEVRIEGRWGLVGVGTPHLYHVLRNLLTNAIRFVDPTGNGQIVILGDTTSRTGMAKVSVTDNGCGMSDEMLAQCGTGESLVLGQRGVGGGFGVGLRLSRRIVERWGGELVVQSVLGGGSTFTISIPVERGWAQRRNG